MPDRTADTEQTASDADGPHYGRSLVQERVVITLRTDSFDCPDCGNIVVATDDQVIDLEAGHRCAKAPSPPLGGGRG